MTKTAAPAVPEAAASEPGNEITLTEFCIRLSERVRRPELISAFESSQTLAGNLKADAEAFQARFDKFVKTPV